MPKTARYLKFGGKKRLTIAAGETAVSDPLAYDLKPLQRLAITISYGETPVNATSHRGSRTTSYIIKGEAQPKTKFTDIEKSLLKANLKLDQLCATTSETRTDIKSLNKDLNSLSGRVTVVERDLKTAFEKIDELKGKIV